MSRSAILGDSVLTETYETQLKYLRERITQLENETEKFREFHSSVMAALAVFMSKR